MCSRTRNLSLALLAALAAATALPGAQTPDADSASARLRVEAQSKRVAARVRALEEEAAGLASQARTLIGDLRALEIARDVRNAQVEAADVEAAVVRATLAKTAATGAALEQERVDQLPDLSARLVEVYKQGRGGPLRLLLGSRNLRDLGRSTRALSSLAQLNRARVDAHRRTLATLAEEQAALAQQEQRLQRARTEAQQARATASAALAARTALIATIDGRRDLNARLLGELQLAQQRLDAAVGNLRTGRSAAPVTVPLGPFRGALDWPVPGAVRTGFGQGAGVVRNGLEIAAADGAPVRAVHPGTVGFADTFEGYGTLVIVNHGAADYSLYGYLSAAAVTPGQQIDAGTEVGRVGLAPAGPAGLYFELRVDDRSVDPLQWLKSR